MGPGHLRNELSATIRAGDTTRARHLLQQHPELTSNLDDALPDAAFGETALLAAVHNGNRDMVDLLLRSGANINQRSHWWAGSFGVLDDPGDLEDFLIERGAVVDVHAAARIGRMDRLRELVEHDPALVHARGGDGQTPLHFARNTEAAQYLLDHGAALDPRDIDHESTPAQYMVRDRQDVARYLVERGCRTDILMAAALGDIECVRRHLDGDPESIRMEVSESYFPKQDQRSGGTIYIWTLGWHKTAHLVAREFGHEEIFRMLMDRSPVELRIALACELGEEALCRQIMAAHPNLAKGLSAAGRRRLVAAAQGGNTAAVRLMLEAGWPPDSREANGTTAVHWAAFHGNLEMTRELLARGAPVDARESEFHATPMGWALHGREHGWRRKAGNYAEVIEALTAAGGTR